MKKTYAVLLEGIRQPVLINADSIHIRINDKTANFKDSHGDVLATFRLATLVGVADVTATSQKPIEQQEVLLLGEPGCHGGGCPDASEPCKECNSKGWCWCSTCCVAVSERLADWKTRDERAKEKARTLAQKLGLSTENTE